MHGFRTSASHTTDKRPSRYAVFTHSLDAHFASAPTTNNNDRTPKVAAATVPTVVDGMMGICTSST